MRELSEGSGFESLWDHPFAPARGEKRSRAESCVFYLGAVRRWSAVMAERRLETRRSITRDEAR